MVAINSHLTPVFTRTDLLIFAQILYYYVVIWLLSAYGGVSYACQEKEVPPRSTRPFTAVYRLMIRFRKALRRLNFEQATATVLVKPIQSTIGAAICT